LDTNQKLIHVKEADREGERWQQNKWSPRQQRKGSKKERRMQGRKKKRREVSRPPRPIPLEEYKLRGRFGEENAYSRERELLRQYVAEKDLQGNEQGQKKGGRGGFKNPLRESANCSQFCVEELISKKESVACFQMMVLGCREKKKIDR